MENNKFVDDGTLLTELGRLSFVFQNIGKTDLNSERWIDIQTETVGQLHGKVGFNLI